ncbi:MAG: leucine-rich repeat protein [Lachnospiraceae bacterium]|nr:leucine-rich repeat protein [Lachnospiraceae bacterium]
MIKKKLWKRSLSLFLACSLVFTSGCFDFQIGSLNVSVANVSAEGLGAEAETVQSTESSVSDNNNQPLDDDSGQNVEGTETEGTETEGTETEGTETEGTETEGTETEGTETEGTETEGTETEDAETEESEVSDIEATPEKSTDDVISGGGEEGIYAGVSETDLASTVITDTALLKGYAKCILSDENKYATMTVGQVQSYTGEIDLSDYTAASSVRSLKGAGLAVKATSFNFGKCTNVTEVPAEEFIASQMTSVTLPDSITTIGNQAFYNCANLAMITSGNNVNTLPSNLKTVGTNAFEKCVALTTIIIPDTVDKNSIQHATSIFANCTGLQSVTIGASIANIPDSAFLNSGANGMIVTINSGSKLEKVGQKAFSGTKITTIDFSNCGALGTFGASAFEGSKLVSVVLPDTVTNTGNNTLFWSSGVFSGVSDLTTLGTKSGSTTGKVIIPEYVAVDDTSTSLFQNCGAITSAKIPASWTMIPAKTFSGCEVLSDFTIGQGSKLVSIKEEAFYSAKSLANTDFLLGCANLITIGKGAFKTCTGLKTVVLPATVETVAEEAFFVDTKKTSNEELEVLATMSLEKFEWKTDASTAVSGKKRTIGAYGIAACPSLHTVILPDYSAYGEQFEIGGVAFSRNISLTKIATSSEATENVLPASVTKIEQKAFKGCESLTQIKIVNNPNGKAPILEEQIFEECINLERVELPANLPTIPERIFCNTGLEQLIMGGEANKIVSNTLTEIEDRAFFACQIETLDLSGCSALSEIGGWAFANADNERGGPGVKNKIKDVHGSVPLKTLILPENLSHLFINSGAFDTVTAFTTLGTPGNLTEGVAYIPAYVYNGSPEKVGLGEGVFSCTGISSAVIPSNWTTELSKATFFGCMNISSLDFLVNTNLSALGEQCFAACFGLETIQLQNNISIKKIGTKCFMGCMIESTEAKPMVLPQNLEEIGLSAFEEASFNYLDLSSCSKLKTVGNRAFAKNVMLQVAKMSPSMTDIPRECFLEDVSLTTINIGNVQKINDNAFRLCNNLVLTGTNLDSLTEIGRTAFESCSSLGTIKFGPNLIKINSSAFKSCAAYDDATDRMLDTKKINVDFSNAKKLTEIGTNAFENSCITKFDITNTAVVQVSASVCKGCELLGEVALGDSVKYVNAIAFAGCSGLTTVSLYSSTVVEPKVFCGTAYNREVYTNKNISFIVKPAKETIKIALNETVDFPYYVHMVNEDKNMTTPLEPFLHIVAGDKQKLIPEAEKNSIYLAVSGDIEGYYINSYENETNLVGGTYTGLDGVAVENFQKVGHIKEVPIDNTGSGKKTVDVFKVTGVKEGKYPFYVCCQVQFPLDDKYKETIESNFTTTYSVEVLKAYYNADLYQTYDSKTKTISNELKGGSKVNYQATSTIVKPQLYYDFQYDDPEMDSENIKDYNVTVVSDNPSVMYPGKSSSDTTGKTTGVITTTVAERYKNSKDRKYFYLIPAGVGTANITVYPASHPAGSKDAEKYAKKFTYIVNSDLKSVQISIPKNSSTVNPGQVVQLTTKVTNYLNQTGEVTTAAGLAKYTNNKVTFVSDTPALLTVDGNGLVKCINAENSSKSVNITATAVKSDNTKTTSTARFSVKWQEIKEGSSYVDSGTGAQVTVTKKDSKEGEVTYKKPASTAGTYVKIPSTVTIAGVKYKVTEISSSAFKNNKKIKKVYIPSSVTKIGSKAFYNCTALTTVTGGSKVVTIGSYAFYNCKKLTKITIGKKVTTIGKKAFYNCKKLKTITIKSTVLKKVGSLAFKNIYKKATIKVPKKKLAAYKKLLKGKGQSSKVKIKK